MELTPTITLIEILWVLGGLVAVPATLRMLRRAVRNRAALLALNARRAAGGRPLLPRGYRRSANMDIRVGGGLCLIAGTFLYLGVRSLFYPSANADSWDTLLLGVLLLLAQGVLVVLAVWNDLEGGALQRDYRRRSPKEPPDAPDR